MLLPLSKSQGGPMVKNHPDSESTLLKITHLIDHTLLEVKNREVNFCPSPSPGGEGRGQILKIHADLESTLLKTPYLIPHMMVEVKIGLLGSHLKDLY